MHERNEACPRMLQYKPPRIAMTLLLLAAALHFMAPFTWLSLPSSTAGGILLALLGCAIMLRAWWIFRERGTAICPTAITTVLVTDDIYRLTRNPMYLGIVSMLLGLAVATGGVFFFAAALLFFMIIEHVFCPYEEAKLELGFGNAYTSYRRSTRRWL